MGDEEMWRTQEVRGVEGCGAGIAKLEIPVYRSAERIRAAAFRVPPRARAASEGRGSRISSTGAQMIRQRGVIAVFAGFVAAYLPAVPGARTAQVPTPAAQPEADRFYDAIR